MARIEQAKPRGLIRRSVYRYSRREYGRVLQPAGVLAHHRPLLLGYSAVGLVFERYSRSVEKRLKDLAMLRTAQLTGCEWCLDFGSKLAHDTGVPEEEMRELSRWRDASCFDERDRLVLEYAEAMTRTPVDVSEELFERLRAHFDDRQLVELTMAIGLENMYGRTNWAWGIEGEGLSEGMYCVVPERSLEAELAAR